MPRGPLNYHLQFQKTTFISHFHNKFNQIFFFMKSLFIVFFFFFEDVCGEVA